MKRKAATLVADLRQRIEKGALAFGAQLPSTADLAKTYGITYPTAHKAVHQLVDLGYVYRKHGRGTYVAKRPMAKARKVGVAIHTKTHIFAELAHEVFTGLQEAGFSCQVIPLADGKTDVGVSASLDELIDSNPYAVIAEDSGGVLYRPIFERAIGLGVPVIWHTCSRPPSNLGGHVAGYDRFLGFHGALSHLLQLGHRRIVAYGVEHVFSADNDFMRAIEELKRQWDDLEVIPLPAPEAWSDTQEREALEEVLRRPKRPTAFLCTLDFRAKTVIDVARAMSLRVPEDLSVTGFFNTPWASEYGITSVNVRPFEIANAIVRVLQEFADGRPVTSSVRILTEPELVVRTSTSRPSTESVPAETAPKKER